MQALAEDEVFTDHGSMHPLLRVLAFGGACTFATTLLVIVQLGTAMRLGASVDMDALRDPSSTLSIASW